MQTVVIGGHTRNIGKTSVMAALIRAFAPLGWTAVKITQYGHGICSRDGEPCDCAPTEHPFVLSEERDAGGRGDTCRYLAAGARRSLWLRARQGQLSQAIPLLQQAVAGDTWVMIESNSILEFLKPLLYLVVLDRQAGDFKPSARRFLGLADACVLIEPRHDRKNGLKDSSPTSLKDWPRTLRSWPGLDAAGLGAKPAFPVAPSQYASAKLSDFVRQRLEMDSRFRRNDSAPHFAGITP